MSFHGFSAFSHKPAAQSPVFGLGLHFKQKSEAGLPAPLFPSFTLLLSSGDDRGCLRNLLMLLKSPSALYQDGRPETLFETQRESVERARRYFEKRACGFRGRTMAASVVWVPTFFEIASFVFRRRKNVTRVWGT